MPHQVVKTKISILLIVASAALAVGCDHGSDSSAPPPPPAAPEPIETPQPPPAPETHPQPEPEKREQTPPVTVQAPAEKTPAAPAPRHVSPTIEIVHPPIPRSKPAPEPAPGCEFAFEQGDSALTPVENIQTPYFDKSIDMGLVDAIMSASAQSTLEFIKKNGVEVFQIPSHQRPCQLFENVPKAPLEFKKKWDKAISKQDDGGGLLGLRVDSPKHAILLTSDTSRWTLVHEFMHELFDRDAARAGVKVSELEAAMTDAETKYNEIKTSYQSKPTKAKLSVLSDRLLTLLKLKINFFIHYPLEEITIESILSERAIAGDFKYVPKAEIYESALQIQVAGSSVLKTEKTIRSMVGPLQKVLRDLQDAERADAFDELIEKMDTIDQTLLPLLEKAKKNKDDFKPYPSTKS